MSFMSKYLQYFSIVIFGLFILTYASIVQADDPNEITVADVYEDVAEYFGQTITVPGHLVFPDWDDESSISWEEMTYLYSYQNLMPAFPINPSKLSKKQKKWIKSNCGVDLSLEGGCYVDLTIVVNSDLTIDAIHVEKMGLKDKLTNIAMGKKIQFENPGVFLDSIKLKIEGTKEALDALLN
jgi:hypothetical protein|tara:strand:+ start:1419 stop:1964 length:546 start_codon:yes stop_codon:yes gene_type:complete